MTLNNSPIGIKTAKDFEEFSKKSTYAKKVAEGKYKNKKDVVFGRGCPPHLEILTDDYLYELLYKIEVEEPLTLEETGDLLGISRERVRQIEFKAIRKMRLNASALKEYY